MTYLTLVLAVGIGYLIGLLQNGIKIYPNSLEKMDNQEYNESYGVDEIKEYYDDTEGMNNF